MNKIIKLSLALALILSFSSCYKDLSKFADNPIEVVVIDTTGMSGRLYAVHQEVFNLAPKFKYSDIKSLSFEWSLSDKPKGQSGATLQPIGNEAELKYKIQRPISSNPYMLRLAVTDRAHGDLQYYCSWELFVQGAFTTGLLVADTKDGGKTSNFTYVKNSDFSGTNYKGEETIMRDLLGDQSTSIQGEISSLQYNVRRRFYHPRHISQVWATTTDGNLIRYDTKDFSVNGRLANNDLILYNPTGMQVNYLFKAADGLYAKTTHGMYVHNPDNTNIFSTSDPQLKDIVFSNEIVAVDSYVKDYNAFAWFDESAGAFMVRTKVERYGKYVLETYAKNTAFDPNKLNGKIALAGEIAHDQKTAVFLLKDKNAESYAIYTLTQGEISGDGVYKQGSAQGVFTIPSSFNSTMSRAVSYILNKRANILYVVTSDQIYAVTFGLGNEAVVVNTPAYKISSGEQIKKAKLFVQGQYIARSNDAFFYKEIPYNLNAITIIAEKDNKDIVYVIPFAESYVELNASKGHRYDGFGKVLDVISIGM